jgi:hypothetical protein
MAATWRLAGAAIAALLLAACGSGSPSAATPTPVPNVCGANSAPYQAGLRPVDFGYRRLDTPRPGDTVRNPLVVRGDANPFEGAYSVTVFDGQGRRLAARDLFKDNQFLAFTAEVAFTVAAPTPACVWVHESSGRDGSPINVTQVPVLLLP